jgi:anionic cell wall polymer biosynthesis LytR-Cps2A-Psr (LCP) family protein
MMLIHIPADRKWAEVMSIPRDSWVNIPSCTMGNGQTSSPTQFKVNEAYAIGNLYGNHTALGAACTIKTLEQATGIYAGYHWLTPAQALAYVRARDGLGDGSDLERITRQQAFLTSLISRARSELLNPLAIYRFLDAATSSLAIDSQLGGVTGLYGLEQSLRSTPSNKIAMFTLPNFPRADVVPSDTANVLWSQPEDSEIFASFRDDIPASSSLLTAPAPRPAAGAGRFGKFGVPPSASPSAARVGTPARIPGRTAGQSICVS